MIRSKFIFSYFKQHNFINGTQNMQFYNVTCCFLWYLPYFYPLYEFKFNVLVFLFMGPPQKLVLAPGVTIRHNTVFQKWLIVYNVMYAVRNAVWSSSVPSSNPAFINIEIHNKTFYKTKKLQVLASVQDWIGKRCFEGPLVYPFNKWCISHDALKYTMYHIWTQCSA